jgi:AcrR family transcriptional regulator
MLDQPERRLTKGAATRQKVIFAAAKVLSDKGYAGTKLDDIAREAATKAGSLYYHVASREEISREVLNACMEMITEEVEAALAAIPEDSPFEEILRRGIDAHLRAILSDKPYMAAYNRIIYEVPEEMRAEFVTAPRRYAERWQQLILRAQDRKELRKDIDPTLFRLLLFGSVTWSQIWFKKPGRMSLDDLTNHLVEVFLWGAAEFSEDK